MCVDIFAQHLFKKEKPQIEKFYQINFDIKLKKGINVLSKEKFKKLVKNELEDPITEGQKLERVNKYF